MTQINANSVAPYALQMVVSQGLGQPTVDLTTVSAAVFKMKRPDGSVVTWTATLSAASQTSLTLTYLYAAGDLVQLGQWTAVANMTVPGGTVKSDPMSFTVVDEFAPIVGS